MQGIQQGSLRPIQVFHAICFQGQLLKIHCYAKNSDIELNNVFLVVQKCISITDLISAELLLPFAQVSEVNCMWSYL